MKLKRKSRLINMDQLERNINALEREMQISQVNPWKVIGFSILTVTLLGIFSIWWFKPKSLTDNDEISYTKTSQFMLALLVGSISILWIFWNLYMY